MVRYNLFISPSLEVATPKLYAALMVGAFLVYGGKSIFVRFNLRKKSLQVLRRLNVVKHFLIYRSLRVIKSIRVLKSIRIRKSIRVRKTIM